MRQFTPRIHTAAVWAQLNPILPIGVDAIESDTGRRKSGDSVTRYANLRYQPTPWAWANTDPAQISGLVRRMRPTGLGLADGAKVASLPYQVGALTLAQSNTGLQPTFVAAGAKNQPAVRFSSAAGTWMSSAVDTLAQPLTIAMILKMADVSSDAQFLHLGGVEAFATGGKWSAYAGTALTGTISETTDVCLVVWEFAGASSSIYVNNASAGSGNVGSGTVNGTYRLGSHPSGSRPISADLYEILEYSQALGSNDLATLRSYAQSTYGTA